MRVRKCFQGFMGYAYLKFSYQSTRYSTKDLCIDETSTVKEKFL
jgi:hypothetical protein